MNTETDLAEVLKQATASYRDRFLSSTPRQLEVVVPRWWVQHWGHEAIAAASARLNCKITVIDTGTGPQDQLETLVFEAGTWHHEPSEPIDLSGARQ